MPIKITPRCSVDPAVLKWYQGIAESKLLGIYQEIQSANPRMVDVIKKRHTYALTTLTPIAKGEGGPGVGLDFLLSRLRSLDLGRIEIKMGHLTAFTREGFKIEEIGRFDHRGSGSSKIHTIGWWNCGVYAICIPLDDFCHGNLQHIHFIPQRRPTCISRHMHHYSHDPKLPPLKRQVSTCWSEFAPVVSGAMHDLDIVETLRSLRSFVGRYYNGSPLRSTRSAYAGDDGAMDEWMDFEPVSTTIQVPVSPF